MASADGGRLIHIENPANGRLLRRAGVGSEREELNRDRNGELSELFNSEGSRDQGTDHELGDCKATLLDDWACGVARNLT